MEDRSVHTREAAGSTPAPATTSRVGTKDPWGRTYKRDAPLPFDGERRWKNGRIARPRKGRNDQLRVPRTTNDGRLRIDLRFKAWRHLRGKVARDWNGRYHFPDGKVVDEFQYPSHRKIARRVDRERRGPGKYGAVARPEQSRAHLRRDGIYIKSGLRVGEYFPRGTRRSVAPNRVDGYLSNDDYRRLLALAKVLEMPKTRLCQLALVAFVEALEQSLSAREALKRREHERIRRAREEAHRAARERAALHS